MISMEDLHVFVRWRLFDATGVAYASSNDARQRPKERISRPEAAHTEGGTLDLGLLQLAWHFTKWISIVTLEDRTRQVRAALVRN